MSQGNMWQGWFGKETHWKIIVEPWQRWHQGWQKMDGPVNFDKMAKNRRNIDKLPGF